MTAVAAFYQEPSGVPAEQVACRGSRHHWMESIPVPANEPRVRGTINVWWRCIRCGTERHDQLNAFSLDVEGRKYVYPQGYLRSKEDMLSPATWRATYLRLVGAISERTATRARAYRRELWEHTEKDRAD